MATQLENVQAFADAALAVNSDFELNSLMCETARQFGADFYLMIHHADFASGAEGLVRLGNYPWDVVSISRQDGRPLHDPVLEACERTLTGFFLSDVATVINLTEHHRRRMEAVEQAGLGDGFCVPAHIPGEHVGSCHFATKRGRRMAREHSAALQLIGTFGFEAARRLASETKESIRPSAPLTDRHRECIILSARGKSDTVIAQLLGLSPKTVNSYVEEAKRRYGVATRAQLIVHALYASEITFRDIVEAHQGRMGPAVYN
jgi:LuxR family transcriptional regulator, quorum-sensing system regulator CciR